MIETDEAVVSNNQKVKQHCTTDSFSICSRNEIRNISVPIDDWHGSDILLRDIKTT